MVLVRVDVVVEVVEVEVVDKVEFVGIIVVEVDVVIAEVVVHQRGGKGFRVVDRVVVEVVVVVVVLYRIQIILCGC